MILNLRARISLVILTFILFSGGYAQEQNFTISGQIRSRSELNGKDFNNSTAINQTTALRTRINLSFTTPAGDQALVQIQDYRNYGTETNTLTDGTADRLDLHQAYYKANNIGGFPLSVKVGRQEVVFGNERLVGAVGWDNIGRSFDGTVVTFAKGKIKLDGFYMKQVESSKAGNVDDQDFRGVWLDTQWEMPGLVNSTSLDAFFLNQLQIKGSDALSGTTTTVGIFSKGSYGLVGVTVTQEIDYALQMGTRTDGTDISASMIGLRLGLSLGNIPFKPKVGVGYDNVSGDDADAKYGAFNTLYATNHKFYGFMDFFLNVPVHALGYGLTDIILSGGVTPMAGLGLNFAYHMFTTDQAATITAGVSNDIGTELDITANYGFRKGYALVAGYSIFTPGAVFQDWKSGSDSASWGYLMTIFNF